MLLKAKGHQKIILELHILSFSSEIYCSELGKHNSTSLHFCRFLELSYLVEVCNARTPRQTSTDIHLTRIISEQPQTAEGGIIQNTLICRNQTTECQSLLK